MSENVKRYKPLLSSAPADSILNAQAFHYTNSVDTDIRRTFARIRREPRAFRDHERVRQLAAVAFGYVHRAMRRRP
jgi:hypothetical protein